MAAPTWSAVTVDQAEGLDGIDDGDVILVRFGLRLGLSCRWRAAPPNVEKDRLAVDSAVPSPHFQADFLLFLGVVGAFRFLVPTRFREGRADQLIHAAPPVVRGDRHGR